MINYPRLAEQPSSREMVDVFKGYNRNLRIKEGEFSDMENLSSDCYPVLSVRKQRRTVIDVSKLEGEVTGVIMTDRWGLLHTQGGNLYSNGAIMANLELNDEPKRFVMMGQNLIILPDMKYVNLGTLQGYGSMGHVVEVTKGEVTFELCNAEGEVYDEATVSATAPEDPADQELWIDSSVTPHILKQYSKALDQWAIISTTYVKISGLNRGTDGQWFSQYDGVTISGITAEGATHLNGSAVLQSKSNVYNIVVVGILDETVKQTCSADSPVRIERKIPAMDYVIEAGNRLWGCRHDNGVNEIYASKLGDFKNWNCFMGISTDSWVGSVGSQGDFTGAANIGGCPVFYKADMRHKVWISDTGAHQISSTPCQGVQQGCGGSVATMDGVAIYKSYGGFCMDDGSGPEEIGACFAGARYNNAVGCAWGHKYYVSMENDEGWHLFVYDADKKLWHREDDFHAISFSSVIGCVIAVENGGKALIDMNSGEQQDGRMEGTVHWMAQTGEIGIDSPDQKYISRLTLRLSMEVGAELTIYAQYDMEPEWVALGSIRGTSLRSFSLPIRPRRCDHLRLRFEGEGDVNLYSITKTIEEGSAYP